MTCFVYAEPLDPLRIAPQRRDAGLAREKHRWLLRTLDSPDFPEAPFTYGHDPVREANGFETDIDGAPVLAVPVAGRVLAGEVPLPPLTVAVLAGPGGEACAAAGALAAGEPAPVWLAFAPGVVRRPGAEPTRADLLLAEVLGAPVQADEARTGWVLLPPGQARRRAAALLGAGWGHRPYLVAGDPPPELRGVLAPRPGAAAHDEPAVEFRAFHALAAACEWVLTSAGAAAGAAAWRLYSPGDAAAVLVAAAPGQVEVVGGVDALHRAAGVARPARGGRALAGFPPGALRPTDGRLSLSWSDLDSLRGVDRFAELRELEIDGTAVSDLAPLEGVPRLESLSARSLQVDSLRPLAALPRLRRLAVDRPPGDGLAALAELPALEELDLALMPLRDAAPLAGCAGLRRLVLDRTRVATAAPLAGLPALASLSLRRTPARDLSPLAGHTGLRELALDGCAELDLRSLAGLEGVRDLALGGWGGDRLEVTDAAGIAALPALRRLAVRESTLGALPEGPWRARLEALDLTGSAVVELGWAAGSALRELDVSGTEVADLEPLRALPALRRLGLAGCAVRDADILRALTGLEALDVGASWIEDFGFLEPLAALRELRVPATRPARVPAALAAAARLEILAASGWRMADLPWLPAAARLRVLLLDGTDLPDTAPLARMPALEEVEVSGTPVAGLEGLAGAAGLRRLRLDRTPVRDLAPLSGLRGLRELGLRGTRPDSLLPLAGLPALRRLDLRQVDPREVDLAPLLELPRLELLMIETHGIDGAVLDELRSRHRLFLRPT